MKRFLALLLALCMVFALCACNSDSGKKEDPNAGNDYEVTNKEYKVAMITDYGDITDKSFNQTTYEACKEFCKDNGVAFKYYKPTDNNTDARVKSTEQAISEGYNIIVMPGYAFAGTLVQVAPQYPDVKFVALDVAEGDLLEAAVGAAGEEYDFNPSNWELADYFDMRKL